MIREAYDYSEPITPPTYIRLFISWDDSQEPEESEVEVSITVLDLDPNTGAEIAKMNPLGSKEYEYELKLVESDIPEQHDQSLPIYNLPGRPKAIYAGFTGQSGTSRANTVAL